MSEWKKIKLKEILKEVSERNKGEKVKRVLSVTNSQGFVDQEEYFEGTVHSTNISNYKIIRKNQFAYNPSRVNVGSIDILKKYDEGAISPMYVIFEVDETRILPEYFMFYFQTHRFFENVKNNTQGSVRNSLNFKALADFDYLLPPLEEQREIVNVLNNVDLIIGKYENLLKNKEQFIKSLFVEVSNNQMHYTTCKIGDIYKFQYGKGNNIPVNKGIYPCYGSNGQVGFHTEYNNEDAPIIGHIGAYAGIVIWASGKHFVTYNGVMCFLKDKKVVNPKYGYYLLKNQEFLNNARRGGAQPFVSYDMLEAPIVKIPSMDVQIKFSNIVEQIDKQKFELENIIENYRNLKKGLMQQLLTGKIKVKI